MINTAFLIEDFLKSTIPKSQKARHTRRFAPSKRPWIFDLHIAHEEEGAPGSGSILFLYLELEAWLISNREHMTFKKSCPESKVFRRSMVAALVVAAFDESDDYLG